MLSTTPPRELGEEIADLSSASRPTAVTLTGRHATLSPLTIDDVAGIYDAIGNIPNLWTYLTAGPFPAVSVFWDWLSDKVGYVFYTVRLAQDGQIVGLAALGEINTTHKTIEVGPVVIGPKTQRSKASTEVLYLLGQYVFEELGFRRWEWQSHSLNAASRKAAHRLGFTYEGTMRQKHISKGRNRDTCIYSMLDSEWHSVRRGFELWLDDANFDESGTQRKGLLDIRAEGS